MNRIILFSFMVIASQVHPPRKEDVLMSIIPSPLLPSSKGAIANRSPWVYHILHNSKFMPQYDPRLLAIESVKVYRQDVVVKRKGERKPLPETTRSDCYEFSEKSRKRLAFYANNTDIVFRSMLTLTYPRDFPSDGRTVKKHLNRLLSWLRSLHDNLQYLWFLEFQSRGAPHIHILFDCLFLADRSTVARRWYDAVGSGDWRHLQAGIRLERVRKPQAGSRYATKYALKMHQKRVPKDYQNVGRMWGCSRGVIPQPKVQSSEIAVEELERLLDGWGRGVESLDKGWGTLFGASAHILGRLTQ